MQVNEGRYDHAICLLYNISYLRTTVIPISNDSTQEIIKDVGLNPFNIPPIDVNVDISDEDVHMSLCFLKLP